MPISKMHIRRGLRVGQGVDFTPWAGLWYNPLRQIDNGRILDGLLKEDIR